MADDPFKDYNIFKQLWESNIRTVAANPIDAMQHTSFPQAMSNRILRANPELGPRVDRGLLDMALNFAGGYDWAAREGITPEVAKEMARSYQYKDYGSRPEDSIQDYYENVAGIDAFTGERVPHESLINMALEYARKKAGQ